MKLSILCVTRAESHSFKFLTKMSRLAETLNVELVIAADGPLAFAAIAELYRGCVIVRVDSKGYIESVLDESISACNGDFVLRLDDDEACSLAMEQWLIEGKFLEFDHWQFPRVHLWPDEDSVLMTPQLFPDHQTRLSTRNKSGGRHGVHAGSPFGGGEIAPVMIEHWKFLVKSYDERLDVARRYDAYHQGYGTGNMRPFSLPEDVYDQVLVIPKNKGLMPLPVTHGMFMQMRRVSA